MSKSGKTWSSYFLELLVVIVGITIAFTLDRWSNTKKEQDLELSYKASLVTDLEKDVDALKLVMDSTETIIRYVSEVFQFNYSNAPLDSYTRYHVVSSYLTSYFYPQNGTYVSLVNSGDISVIKDFELKKQLSDHYNVKYKEIERIDNVIKNLVDNIVQPYVIDYVEFSPIKDGIEDAKPLKTNKAINMLGSVFNLLKQRQIVYDSIRADAEKLVKRVKEEAK